MTEMTRQMLVFGTIVFAGTLGSAYLTSHFGLSYWWAGIGCFASFQLAGVVVRRLKRRQAAQAKLEELRAKYGNLR